MASNAPGLRRHGLQTEPRYRVGIDVGGTFTDLFLLEESTGRTYSHKVSSTPSQPHLAPIAGLKELLDEVGIPGSRISFVGLGTTVATNALLEWNVAKTGLITTRGFRDLLEIGRQKRPSLYDPFQQKPVVPVPRHLRLEVDERTNADGSIARPLDIAEVLQAVDALRCAAVSSIAVCFLNSYKNPSHELQAAELIRKVWTDVHVVSSYEVMPEFREYERFVSTAINAALIPHTSTYLQSFREAIRGLGIEVEPLVMSSSGGVFNTATAGKHPIDTLFSGPSGGVSSAEFLGGRIGVPDLITFDMGGTSTEVCMIRNGKAQKTFQRTIKGYPIRVASHDIHTIGAGGSSIAAIDEGNMLSVGPKSAGADPGPVCYDKGGKLLTVTDANVALGRLNQHYLLGGAVAIDAGKSAAALEREIAGPKGTDMVGAAGAVVALAEANMAQALRVVTVERGIDPAAFSLVALGGAGPLHAAAIAREVGMARIIVPRNPGVFCALGVLTKDIQLNLSRTRLIEELAPDALQVLDDAYELMQRQAAQELESQYGDRSRLYFERHADVRYSGQNHEITIPVAAGPVGRDTIDQARASFHKAHEDLYGYRQADSTIVFVTLRLDAVIPVPRPDMDARPPASDSPLPPAAEHRRVYFGDKAFDACPVYQRKHLAPGHALDGPAIIEQMDSTTVVPPGFRARVDAWSNIEITW